MQAGGFLGTEPRSDLGSSFRSLLLAARAGAGAHGEALLPLPSPAPGSSSAGPGSLSSIPAHCQACLAPDTSVLFDAGRQELLQSL